MIPEWRVVHSYVWSPGSSTNERLWKWWRGQQAAGKNVGILLHPKEDLNTSSLFLERTLMKDMPMNQRIISIFW